MARMIYDRLRLEKHYECFLDVEALGAGNYKRNVEIEMKNCDIFILILSKNALDRCNNPNDPVRQEIISASNHNLAFIPVLSEDFEWPLRMPEGMEEFLDLNAIRYVQTYSNEFFEKLYKFIDQIRYAENKQVNKPDTDNTIRDAGQGKPVFIKDSPSFKIVGCIIIAVVVMLAIIFAVPHIHTNSSKESTKENLAESNILATSPPATEVLEKKESSSEWKVDEEDIGQKDSEMPSTNTPSDNNQNFFRDIKDSHERTIKRSYYGGNNEPVLTKDGYAGWTAEYDSLGNMIRQNYFGLNGEPVLIKDKITSWTAEYDSNGNMVKQYHFGLNGELVLDIHGFAGWTAEYDGNRKMTKTSYFGLNGEPVLCFNDYAGWTAEYDFNGNLTKSSYFGLNGEPVLQKTLGYSSKTLEYDSNGNKTKESYYGIKGEPVLSKDGIASWTAEYDDKGNQTKMSFYGINDKPIATINRIASWTAEYDAEGNQTKKSYFGLNGEPVLLNGSVYSTICYEYDSNRNNTKVSYYGINGEPVADKNGIAGWTAEYDANGNQTKESYFGLDGEPAVTKEGYVGWMAEYDADGNLTQKEYYGLSDELIQR